MGEKLQELEKVKKTLYCSFCSKTNHEVFQLIAGPGAFICDECVEMGEKLIKEEKVKRDNRSLIGAIEEELDNCRGDNKGVAERIYNIMIKGMKNG